jgi:hypothetical protein
MALWRIDRPDTPPRTIHAEHLGIHLAVGKTGQFYVIPQQLSIEIS